MTKLEAVIKALGTLGDIAIVDAPGGGYEPIYKNCRTCKHDKTGLTKRCASCHNLTCDRWEAS